MACELGMSSKRQVRPVLLFVRLVLAALLGLLLVAPLLAFLPIDVHPIITRDALQQITRQVDGQTLQFSERAISQVIGANIDTDCGGSAVCRCNSCQKDSSRHFDSEDFLRSTSRLKGLKERIIGNITSASPHGPSARYDLGQAFHTIQDYYSHSNWVNMGFIVIDARLGQESFDHTNSGPPPLASPSTETCPNDAGQLEGDGLHLITTGFFDVADRCSAPASKCRHGGFSGCLTGGLSKDHVARPLFAEARDVAKLASIDYVNQILNDPAVANNPRAIKALMDAEAPALVVAISDSASAPVLASGQVWG